MITIGHIPYGYKIIDGKAMVEVKEARKVIMAYNLYLKGKSLQLIGDELDLTFNHSTIGKMLKNKKYLGDEYYPKIINEDVYMKVQKERKARVIALGRNKNYFASDRKRIWDIIYCKECGSMFRRYSKNKKMIWKCSKHIVNRKPGCKSGQVKDEELQYIILKLINYVRNNLEYISSEDKSPVNPKIALQINKPVESKDLLYKRAEIIYGMCKVEDFSYQTKKLLKVINKAPLNIIKKIIVDKKSQLSFELINGKEVTLHEQNGVSNTS